MHARVLRLKKSGEHPELSLEAEALTPPNEGEVRVKLTSIGLNRADLLFQQNRYFQKPELNSRLGFEGGGIIDAVGPNTPFSVGDRVSTCPMAIDVFSQGCLADYATFTASQLLPCPSAIASDSIGAIWMAYLTAWGGLLDAGKLKIGNNVVITAASSSVGIAAIQIAKQHHASVIATTTSPGKFEALKELGADAVILQPREPSEFDSYLEAIKTFTQGQGSDLVFDAVAGPASHALIKASKRGGRIIFHGLLDRRPMDVHAGVLMKRLLTLKGYTLDQTLSDSDKKIAAVKGIYDGIETGSLKPVIAKFFTLEQYQSAFDYLRSNQQFGKVVIHLK